METKMVRPRRNRSVVWYYFEKVEGDSLTARCKVCGALCHHAMNTSNLFKHIRVKHPHKFKEAEETRELEDELYRQLRAKSGKPVPAAKPKLARPKLATKPSPSPSTSGAALVKTESSPGPAAKTPDFSFSGAGSRSKLGTTALIWPSKSKSQNVGKALVRMLARDMLPASLLAGKGFQEFLSGLRVNMPSKKDISKTLLPALGEETKVKVKDDLAAAKSLALGVEEWTYRDSRAFFTVSAHFLREDWSLSSLVLETFDCTDEKTETNIATQLKRLTDDWGITDHVMALVSSAPNEGISNTCVLNSWKDLTCFGHTLNRVINDALASVPELTSLQNKLNKAVAFFDVNVKASETLEAVQQQHSLPVHNLKRERRADWTSTFAMFTRMVEQYEAVNTVLCFLGCDEMCICDDEVEVIRGVLKVLKPFQAATLELCTEPYTCLSKLIPIATLLQQVTTAGMGMDAAGPNLGPSVALRDALISQMQQHFSGLEMSEALSAATLLDPRFKQHAFTDSAALEAAKQRLLADTQVVVQSSNTVVSISSCVPVKPDFDSEVGDNIASFWGMFDKKVVAAGAAKTNVSEAENETRRFFKEVNISRTADPLHWWRLNEVQFPHLKVLAKKFLCFPATAIPSGRLFTKEGDEFSRRRDLFKPGQLNNIIFLNQNLC